MLIVPNWLNFGWLGIEKKKNNKKNTYNLNNWGWPNIAQIQVQLENEVFVVHQFLKKFKINPKLKTAGQRWRKLNIFTILKVYVILNLCNLKVWRRSDIYQHKKWSVRYTTTNHFYLRKKKGWNQFEIIMKPYHWM